MDKEGANWLQSKIDLFLENEDWLSKEYCDLLNGISMDPPSTQNCRQEALEEWTRIARGEWTTESLIFVQVVAKALLNQDRTTGVKRYQYMADATGLSGKDKRAPMISELRKAIEEAQRMDAALEGFEDIEGLPTHKSGNIEKLKNSKEIFSKQFQENSKYGWSKENFNYAWRETIEKL